jgi:uncharacterized protein (DUF433 family)
LEAVVDAPLVSRGLEIMSGALCFTGTRVPVNNLFDYLEGGSSLEEILEDFPSVRRETTVAVLEAAREQLSRAKRSAWGQASLLPQPDVGSAGADLDCRKFKLIKGTERCR